MAEENREVIFEKIESLRNCLVRLRENTPSSLEKLKKDLNSQDILSVNLQRVVQICVDIAAHIVSSTNESPAPSMADNFLVLKSKKTLTNNTAQRMVKAVGLRNLLVHEYRKINWTIVYKVLTSHLNDFENFAKEILRKIEPRKNR